MWWYEEDFECIMKLKEFNESMSAYSDKHEIETSWADERIKDEGYGMNNEWQTGRIKVRGQSSREKLGIDVKNLQKGIKNLKKPGFNPKNKKP